MWKQTTLLIVGGLSLAVSIRINAAVPPTASELGLMMGAPPTADKLVTAENFVIPPYNRWSFQHLRELFPTRAVPASHSPWILPSKAIDFADVVVDFDEGRSMTVGTWLASAYTDGFIVLDRGTVVHEQYENSQTPSTQHLMFSVTKSFTGAMILQLMEQGAIDGTKTVASYVPELSQTAFGDATVQQVMDMTNSIAYDETYDDPNSDIANFLTSMYLGGEGLYSHLQSLTSKQLGFEHGEAFHYVTPDPEVLGWIIRRIEGQTLADVIYQRLWSKLGTEFEAHYWVDPTGVEMAGGGLSMTLRDAARFGQMILDDGQANGEQVLSADIAQRIKTPRNQATFNRYYQDAWYGSVAQGYHDQWWSYAGVDAVAALGVHGQFIYINSEHDVVIVKQSSDPDAENDRVDSETPMVMHAIAEFLGTQR
ncbi:MAG: CubicO group peptidase (beta-lactamase class C family) [Glaciecola sp.]|jgi:CubicO group peptidase (beta-lactamase class C family)|uniref:serine hydrolase domain-containing protein n=1 Tax=Congregibacter sp. TaxID=2744308 RepID=UPI0039E64214